MRCRDAPPQRLLDALEMKPRAHAGPGGLPRERPDLQGAGAGGAGRGAVPGAAQWGWASLRRPGAGKDGGAGGEGKEDAGEGGGAAEVVPLRSSKSA